MKALKTTNIAAILVLSVILSTFAAVTPVSAATLSAQQYLEKMDIAVRNLNHMIYADNRSEDDNGRTDHSK